MTQHGPNPGGERHVWEELVWDDAVHCTERTRHEFKPDRARVRLGEGREGTAWPSTDSALTGEERVWEEAVKDRDDPARAQP